MSSKKFLLCAIVILSVCLLGFVSCKEPEHDHIWTEVKSSAALKTPGDDTTKAVYWKTCSICGAISDTETFDGLYMPAAPAISVAGGTFDAEQTVELSSVIAGAKIYYTLDGSDPTSASTLYAAPITIGADSVLKAVVIVDSEDYDPSAVASAEYKFSWGVYNKTSKTGFATLKDAFAAIANGDELVVNKNLELELGTADTAKVGFVLDLNGHTLTSGAINASGGPAALKFRGTAAAPIDSIVIKNGTVIGGVNGNQSSALVYFNYVTEVTLANLNLINEAYGTGNAMSNALYNAYSTITIDNTEDNEILGRVIAYMNDTVDAKFRTTYIINGGTFYADGTTGATDKDTASILVSDSKGSSLIIFNDGIVEGQFVMATDAPELKSSIVLNGGTFAYNIELPGTAGPTKIADFVPETSDLEQKSGKYIVTPKYVEPPHEHTFGEPVYEWSVDFKCTATRSCTGEGCTEVETETVNGVYAVVTDPTTTSVGAGTYTATFTNEAFAQQVKDVEIPMITHNFGTPVYEWSVDNKCTATHTCTDAGCGEVETETVDGVYAEVTPASCTAVGAGTYTATFTKTGFEQQVKNVEIPMTDHVFDQEVVDDAYFVSSGATGLIYKKSCVCGLASDSETFTVVAINKTKSTHYATLAAALAAVSDGDEVILYADQTMATVQLKVGITLDLNGHTVTAADTIATNTGLIGFNAGTTGTGSAKKYIHISKVVIKNGTMKGTTSNNQTNGMLRFAVVDDAVIENVNLIATALSSTSCSNTIWSGYSNLTINNTEDNSIYGTVIIYTNRGEVTNYGANNSTLTVNGGHFSNDKSSGKTWTFEVNEAAAETYGDSSLYINDCIIDSGIIAKTVNGAVSAASHGTVVVKLGTFCQDVTEFLAEGYEVEETVAGKTWVAKKHVHVFDQEVAEAQYQKEGNVYYKSCKCGLASDSETFICNGVAVVPTFSITSGTYNTFQSVTITSADGADIFYTTDGTAPTASSTKYTGPVSIKADTVLKAICAGNGYLASDVASIDVKIETVVNTTTSKGYIDLAAALAAVANGDSLIVYDDQTLAPTKLTVGITLDLNGHTVSCSTALGSDTGIINFAGSATSHIGSVVIKNGSFVGKTGNNMSSGLVRLIHTDSAELSNVNITSKVNAASNSNAIYAGYTGLVINNTDANSIVGNVIIYTNGSVATGMPAVVTVNGGKFSNDKTATAKDWVFTLNEASSGVSTLIFNGGTVESGTIVKAIGGAADAGSHAVVSLVEGTFCYDVTSFVAAGSSISKVGDNWVVTKD